MDAFNPREDFAHVWTWATTRNAGYSDKGAMDVNDWHDMEKAEKYICYPPGLLRHSGDALYVGAEEHWADYGGWDSGCMGVAYMTKKKAVQEFGCTWKNGEVVKQGVKLTKKAREKAFACLKAEVAEMNTYLHGEVYGVIGTCLETEDSDICWGLYCDGKKEIEQRVKDLLPRGMAGEAEDAVVDALEWEWQGGGNMREYCVEQGEKVAVSGEGRSHWRTVFYGTEEYGFDPIAAFREWEDADSFVREKEKYL
jgi:hypothetical protein